MRAACSCAGGVSSLVTDEQVWSDFREALRKRFETFISKNVREISDSKYTKAVFCTAVFFMEHDWPATPQDFLAKLPKAHKLTLASTTAAEIKGLLDRAEIVSSIAASFSKDPPTFKTSQRANAPSYLVQHLPFVFTIAQVASSMLELETTYAHDMSHWLDKDDEAPYESMFNSLSSDTTRLRSKISSDIAVAVRSSQELNLPEDQANKYADRFKSLADASPSMVVQTVERT